MYLWYNSICNQQGASRGGWHSLNKGVVFMELITVFLILTVILEIIRYIKK